MESGNAYCRVNGQVVIADVKSDLEAYCSFNTQVDSMIIEYTTNGFDYIVFEYLVRGLN